MKVATGRQWWKYSRPFRERFGTLRGSRIAYAVGEVEYRRPAGDLVPVNPWPGEPPVLLRAGTSDSIVFRQVVLKDELHLRLEPPPRTILDGGANIGLSSRMFVRQWPEARILAVELEAGNARLLARNCAHLPQVTVCRVALWYGDEWVQVSDSAAEEHSFSAAATTAGRPGAVRAVGVRELAASHGWQAIDLVKLDIEGAEQRVFAESRDWLPMVRHLVVELHDRVVPGCSDAVAGALGGDEWEVSTQGEYVVASRRTPA